MTAVRNIKIEDYRAWLEHPLTKALKQSHKQQIASIINLLHIQHEAAKDQHNHWLVAANLVAAEFGDMLNGGTK